MDALLKDLCIKELAAKGTEEGNFGKEGLELKKLQTPYGILIGYYNNSKDTKLKEQVSNDRRLYNTYIYQSSEREIADQHVCLQIESEKCLWLVLFYCISR